MQDFEKLGVFYLGREYDLAAQQTKPDLLLYDSKDLTTHAVCVGMTGSGKTGLCIGLLEEAAIDGIPAILVDPKGDLANMMLTFPDLRPDDFLPWVNPDEAQKKGLSPSQFAAEQASLWEKGLADWGQDAARIRRLKDAAEFAIYTPGSNAGIPVSILKSFDAPESVILEDSELLAERINTTATSLLNLLGVEADPIQSREHILLSTILGSTWKERKSLDLAGLVGAIQTPPVTRVGVMDLESFFPDKDRFGLAMKLNSLLAAPGFGSWLEGAPLDIDQFLYTKDGKPRVSIFSIAHLNDAERMFFVSILLTRLLGWMRTQSGTTSLRALFYMDEIFGYFPPVSNPPSKAPLMTLLKQARAFGLGVVLSTQNPVDLDYKGLSNMGTWFIGRLQTDRDKQRLLDGLEGASAGGNFDRPEMERILAGLGKRVFLMHNVHDDQPVVFQTRWTLSYLSGPFTRNQIKQVMEVSTSPATAQSVPPTSTQMEVIVPTTASSRPVLPPGIPEYFLPAPSNQPQGASLFYEPMLAGAATLYLADAKSGIRTEKRLTCLAGFPDSPGQNVWEAGEEIVFSEKDLRSKPEDSAASFADLPAEAGKKQNYPEWGKAFHEWLFRNQSIELLKSPSLNAVSQPGETERDFRIRLQLTAREKRDDLIDRLRQKYATKMTGLQEQIRRAEYKVEAEKEQAKQQKMQTAISVGATLLGAFLGRKAVSQSTLGRASTAARGASRSFKEAQDVGRAEDNVDALKQRLAALEAELSGEIEQITSSMEPQTETLETFVLRPKKTDISVSLVALAWTPFWQDERGGISPAWR